MKMKPMFYGGFNYLDKVVITLDDYLVSNPPSSFDDKGQANWPPKEYTELGNLVYEYKYQHKDYLCNQLASILVNYMNGKEEYKCITSITNPPSGQKGASIKPIVVEVAHVMGWNYIDAFRKVSSFSMFEIEKEKRVNYIEKFECIYPFTGQEKLLIVDDIVTTGSTFSGCLKAIDRSGRRISVVKLLSFTRTKEL